MTKFNFSVILLGKMITDHMTKNPSVSGTHCKFSGDQSGSKAYEENLA